MSDIVSAFKQNTRRKRANYQDEQEPKELSALSALQQKRQQNTVQQESNTNTALESSQRQNVQLGNNTSESQKLAQLQQLAAQEQAQNAANAAAAQQKQQEQQQQQTQQVQPKDNDGWKKYYDKEKQIVREQAFKSDGFGSWLQDVFNSGWDSRLAEQRARDKYANEMLNQSFNDDGSVKDANKLNEVKQFTAQNMNVAKQYGDYERARGNAIGANLTSDKHNNPFKATANAVRNMDIGNAILGSNDPEGTEGSKYNTARDVGKFLINLVPGTLSAPITGLTNVSEAISGKGTDEQTGLEKELDNLSRVGKGIAGGIDVAGVFFGGSKEALTRVSDALFRKGAEKAVKETSKGVIKNVLDSMIKEGAEEATQQAAEFFGNGGKLVTKDGQFDNDSFKELLAESGKAGALGAVGGGLMNVGGRGVTRLINNSQTKTNTQQGINSNINNNLIAREQAQENLRQKEQQAVEQPVTEDARETENVNKDVSEDAQEDTAERTQVQEEVKETSNTQYEQDVRNSLNDNYRNLSKTITPENKANLDAEIKQLADIRNTMPIDEYAQKAQEVLDKYSQTTAEQVVEPQTESVTGQPVNPQDISEVTAPTVGTQASETPANVKTDVTENNAIYGNEDTDGLTKTYNRYAKRYEDALNSGDKEAISKARDNYNLALKTVAGEDTAQYDVDKGVVVNQVLAEEMFNNGIDGPAANTLHANMFDITDGKPLAHDYTTGEDLYFLDDINNALKRDGYKDAIGNQFKTFAQISKERDNANRQAFQQAIEESIAKSDTVKPTAETELNDLIDTATNFEQHIARLEEDNRNRYKTDFGAGTLWRSDTPHKKGDVTFFTPEKWYAETYEDYIGAAGNAASRGNKLISNDKSLSNIYTIAPDGYAADLLSKGIRGEIERINTGEKSALTMVQREMYDELEKRGVKLRQSNDIVSRWMNFLKNTVTYAGREYFNPVSLNKLFYDERIPGGTPIPTLVKKALDNLGIDGLYLKNPMADKTHVGTPSEVIRFNWEKSTKPVAADNALATQSNTQTNTRENAEPTTDMINDIGYDRNISFDDFEQSRYDYYRSQDPDFKEYDDATINQWIERDWEILQSENDSQANIDQTFDDRVANEYGGESTAETELNDLIDTARNEAPEPIPIEAYGVEPEMEQTPAQQPTTQNETVTTEPVVNIDNLPYRVGNITENYLIEDNYTIDQMRDLSNRINTVAEREANALGTTMENIRREVNRAERAGLSRLDQTELTDAQQDLYRRYLNELNTIRGFAESQGKQIAGDIGELYLPNQMLGWEDNYKPLEGFNTKRPGSEIARGENRIDVEEQDFGTDPIDRYFIEHGASDAVKQQHASEAVSDITGNAEPKPESIKEYIKLQEDINNIVVKNPLKLTQKSGKKPVSPSNVINKIGTDNGTRQQPIYGKARGLTDEDKLTSVEVPSGKSPTGKVSVFEAGGYFAYRQAPSYAADVMNRSKTENGFNSATLRNIANEYIDRFNLSKNDAEHFKNRIDNLSPYLSDKAAEKTLEFIFRDAARTQNVGFLSSHNASGDPKLQQVIDRQSTIMLRDNSIEKSAATKMTNSILKAQNAAFRKMNVSSAINELSDLSSMLSVTGRNFRPIFKRGIAAKYGMSEAEIDPAVMAEISSADGTVDQSKLKTYIKKIGRNADKYTNIYHFVEQYKLNIALTSFENIGINQGLSGKELVDFVTSNTRKVILPVDQFTHTFLNDYPLFTQYMPWTLRNIQKEGKLLIGSYDGGVYQTGGTLSKSRFARVAYNAVTNLPLKTVYWLASNALKGTALATAFGLLELGGDYSGIDDKDKNWYEKYLTQVTGTSTIGSLINSVEYALHKEGLKNQYADSEYNSYENEDLGSSLGDIALTHFVPAGSQIKKTAQEAQVLGQGYSENKAGKVQYLDSDNPLDAIKGLLFGKNSTDNAREYSGNLDVITRIQNKLDEGSDMFSAIVSSITDMAKEDSNIQDREYNRPLSNLEQNNYSQKVKNTTGQEQKDWYEKGRAYNAITDTLRRENPDAYEVYESTFSKEIVSPERYARIAYGNGDKNPESIDLTVWNTMKDLANKRHDDFGTPIDPAYTQLDDEQTRRYLAYKATATGEDVLLNKDMCLDPFWDSFFDKQNDYYNQIGNSEFDDSAYSARVQEWNDWNDQYRDYQKFIYGNIDTMKDQQLALELSLQFPLMTEYQKLKTVLKAKYGDEYKDSQEYKSFLYQNYDAYNEESDAFNQRMLYIINQMRRIEGFDDMTIDQLEAINGFGKDSSKKSSGKSSGKSYGGSDYSYAPKFENIFQADPLYAKEYGGFRPVKPNLTGNPNFENVGFSSTAGKDPYAQV